MTTYDSLSLSITGIQTIAIVATLYAVWRQLRQFNLGMKYDAYSKHIEDYSRITQLLIEKPTLNHILYANNQDFAKLSDEQKDFYNYLCLMVGFLERLYLLNKEGWGNPAAWVSWESWFREQWFPLTIFPVFWKNEGQYFIAEFYEHINSSYEEFKAQNPTPIAISDTDEEATSATIRSSPRSIKKRRPSEAQSKNQNKSRSSSQSRTKRRS